MKNYDFGLSSDPDLNDYEREQIKSLNDYLKDSCNNLKDGSYKDYLTHLKSTEHKATRFLIPNFLESNSITMYYGAKGCFKSTFLRSQMFRYLDGINLTTTQKECIKTVIYFDTENTTDDLLKFYPVFNEFIEYANKGFYFLSLLDFEHQNLSKCTNKEDISTLLNRSFSEYILPVVLRPIMKDILKQRVFLWRKLQYDKELQYITENSNLFNDEKGKKRIKDFHECGKHLEDEPTPEELKEIANNTILCIDNLTSFSENISDKDTAVKLLNSLFYEFFISNYKLGGVVLTNHTTKNKSTFVGSGVLQNLCKNVIPIFKHSEYKNTDGQRNNTDYVCIDYPNADLKAEPIRTVHLFKYIGVEYDDDGQPTTNCKFDYDNIKQMMYNENGVLNECTIDKSKQIYEDYKNNGLSQREIRQKYKIQSRGIYTAFVELGKGDEYNEIIKQRTQRQGVKK